MPRAKRIAGQRDADPGPCKILRGRAELPDILCAARPIVAATWRSRTAATRRMCAWARGAC